MKVYDRPKEVLSKGRENWNRWEKAVCINFDLDIN